MPSTQVGGGCLIVFGLPFIAVGVFVLLMSLGVLPFDEADAKGPRALLAVFGGVFATAGLGVSWSGLSGVLRARAARKRKEDHPLEPWHWDHSWDSRWAESGSLGPAVQGFFGFLFLTAFLSIFHWWGFFSDEGPLPVKIVVVLFDLIALLVLASALYQLFQYFKYGTSRGSP
jgi:hypothetical protein